MQVDFKYKCRNRAAVDIMGIQKANISHQAFIFINFVLLISELNINDQLCYYNIYLRKLLSGRKFCWGDKDADGE